MIFKFNYPTLVCDIDIPDKYAILTRLSGVGKFLVARGKSYASFKDAPVINML